MITWLSTIRTKPNYVDVVTLLFLLLLILFNLVVVIYSFCWHYCCYCKCPYFGSNCCYHWVGVCWFGWVGWFAKSFLCQTRLQLKLSWGFENWKSFASLHVVIHINLLPQPLSVQPLRNGESDYKKMGLLVLKLLDLEPQQYLGV